MEYITFKQFIYTINIRDCYLIDGKEISDNQVLRLYYGIEYKKDNYTEIGWYDYFNKDAVWEILKLSLNKNILDSVVTDFRYNKDIEGFEVYLALRKDLQENLQQYQN